MAGKRISEVEDTSIEFSETKEQRKKSWGKKKKKFQNRISKDCMTITKGVTFIIEENSSKETELFQTLMTEDFPQIQ